MFKVFNLFRLLYIIFTCTIILDWECNSLYLRELSIILSVLNLPSHLYVGKKKKANLRKIT